MEDENRTTTILEFEDDTSSQQEKKKQKVNLAKEIAEFKKAAQQEKEDANPQKSSPEEKKPSLTDKLPDLPEEVGLLEKKKVKKDELISAIEKLYEKNIKPKSGEAHNSSTLKRMKLDHLKAHLQELVEISVETISGGPPATVGGGEETKQDLQRHEEFMVSSLLGVMQTAVYGVEKAVSPLEKKWGTNLDGLHSELFADEVQREGIRDCLREIYKDHSEIISEIVNPYTRLALIFLVSAGNVVQQNRQKNLKGGSSKESPGGMQESV